MRQIFNVRHRLPVILMVVFLCLLMIYHYSYLYPFTNNAFVVANIRPVAADVGGYITNLYVKNEEYVKKGQPLFTVFKKPYIVDPIVKTIMSSI